MPIPPTAVIDLGTNTFHLLIIDGKGESEDFREIYRERRFVKLAEEGIQEIGPRPFARGIEALSHYREVMDRYGVQRYKATGTAALRTARNGEEFVRMARKKANIEIGLIPGDEEARLITKGVLKALPPLSTERILIMDIGGGSVEFIIASDGGTHWARSFPIGVAVLRKRYHHHEPIAAEEQSLLEEFLSNGLSPLWDALKEFPTDHLVGAAGTFDVVAAIMGTEQPTPNSHRIDLGKFRAFYERCLTANLEQRLSMEQVPEDRADMIVVAMILIDVILRGAKINRVSVSNYAMKEGILSEL